MNSQVSVDHGALQVIKAFFKKHFWQSFYSLMYLVGTHTLLSNIIVIEKHCLPLFQTESEMHAKSLTFCLGEHEAADQLCSNVTA